MIHKRNTALVRSAKIFTGGLKPASQPQPQANMLHSDSTSTSTLGWGPKVKTL